MNRLYYGACTPGGTSDIFIEMLANRSNINFEEACPVELKIDSDAIYPRGKYLVDYVKQIYQDFGLKIRQVYWPDNIEYIANLLDSVQNNLWIGCYHHNTTKYIKQAFGDRVTTIAINYRADQFNQVYKLWATWQAGFIWNNDPRFINVKKQCITFDDAVEYCIESGTEQFGFTMLPEKIESADVELNFVDMYNKTQLQNTFKKMNVLCSKNNWEFYQHFVKTIKSSLL